jgi:hypothetical protein
MRRGWPPASQKKKTQNEIFLSDFPASKTEEKSFLVGAT